MNWRILAALSVVALVGCDSDGDGLTNAEEEELGLNPDSADTDGDGLNDAAEVELGTDGLDADTDDDGLSDGEEIANGADPLVVDTDGDGYTDRDEVFEGKDPADASDVIYQGGWPYYFEKDEIGGQAGGDYADSGRRFRRYEMKDQFGDDFDLYDLFNADKPVIVDVSGVWCYWCHQVAIWLDHGETDTPGIYDEFNPLRDALDNGDIYWVTVVSEGPSPGTPATRQDVNQWFEDYPNPNIIVLHDKTQDIVDYMEISGWPSGAYIAPNMKTVYSGSYATAMQLCQEDLVDGTFDGVSE